MIRILLDLCERRPNARFGLDMKEVWGRSLKLSSIRRSSSTNEKGLCRRRLLDRRREIDRATRMPERKPAINRIKHNQRSYLKIPPRYEHLDSVRGMFWPRENPYFAWGGAISLFFWRPKPRGAQPTL